MTKSDIKISDIQKLYSIIGPVKIYYNDELVWDDDLEIGYWIPLDEAMDNFKYVKDWDNVRITDIQMTIVSFHHCILNLFGYES